MLADLVFNGTPDTYDEFLVVGELKGNILKSNSEKQIIQKEIAAIRKSLHESAHTIIVKLDVGGEEFICFPVNGEKIVGKSEKQRLHIVLENGNFNIGLSEISSISEDAYLKLNTKVMSFKRPDSAYSSQELYTETTCG